MKINPISFKGYDVCPIKNLYMQGIRNKKHAGVFNELKEVCKKEGIGLILHKNPGFAEEFDGVYDEMQTPWAQDDKTFVRANGETRILTETRCKDSFFANPKNQRAAKQYESLINFANGLGYECTYDSGFFTGGNTYIGKKPNGDKWVLIGKHEVDFKNNDDDGVPYKAENVCRDYGVKEENIFFISPPNFHIDMAVRPIGYPYILVNDENIAHQNALKQGQELADKTDKHNEKLHSGNNLLLKKYAKADQTVRELEKQGFKPIRIGGVYGRDINYMNAIINEHPDGTISYITNSAKGSGYKGLDEAFERELRAKVPNIRDVYFISGGEPDNNFSKSNAIMEILSEHNGGIHCMTLEEPNFEIWG